ncbi:amidohydrolase [Bordetella genomosp. 10]|uniref:Amidohydrolase n=1 Tax=Bordetella genomosp. 10 TaxID=1416804 RepID=A0A261S106_9BORD|nr:amidohydrolase [Bordetella genomosp. 10]OZI30602.1 amidohydrolase [Bordetella genomosp. 10]
MSSIKIYRARKIITMNRSAPAATHVAVREGRILAVGSAEDAAAWGAGDADARYADHVLMPGLVEGHSHLMAGSLWRYPFVGFHPRTAPDGKRWEGCTDFNAVVQRLRAIEQAMPPGNEPLLAWGFDPIFFGDARMTARDLDQVSATRPIAILHASQHLMNVNTPMLALAGIDADTDIEGIVRDAAGNPSGELQEFAAMFPVNRAIGNAFRLSGMSLEGLRNFGQIARLAGVTTATDLVNDLSEDSLNGLLAATTEAGYPCRVVPAFNSPFGGLTLDESIARVREAALRSHDKLRLGAIKIVADGSIQGFTARVRWPGYYNGAPNGIWILPPDELRARILGFHKAGLQMHIHVNGDEATEVVIDALEAALTAHPRPDHRHTLQHCQMADAAQFRRMAALGLCVNLFANHIYYWGDAHHALTMGPDRANRMDACGTALAHGVPMAMHSDAPITPLGPLFTAWCAVNRRTSSGRLLGEAERITVAQALHAITLGAAYTLKMDDRIGSIEVGKHADFCVMEDDPETVDPAALKDVRIAGTVVGGEPTLGLAGEARP